MRRLTSAAIALVLAFTAGSARALPPVWVVRDHDSTLVMFGSVHLLPPGTDWRPAALKDALAHADQVWFEAPMDQAGLSAATQAALAHAFLPEGQSLQAMLSPAGRTRLASAAKLFDVPVSQFDKLQPWYAELMVQSALFEQIGIKGSDGVEQQLWAGLDPDAKRVTLETPEQQIDFFAGAPMKEQLASLEQTLKDVPNARRDYQELLKAWLGADVKMLDRKVVEPLKKSSPTLYSRVVTQRNARWVQAIDQRMKGKGETVMVVGMGHLIGPDGVPARLRAQGFKVEGPR
jgi:uncharacterized protein YbaP (TraB family)